MISSKTISALLSPKKGYASDLTHPLQNRNNSAFSITFSNLGRFLEHSRIYRFENGGDPRYLIGSANWMRRNLDKRIETTMPVTDPDIKKELEPILSVYAILSVYEADNTCSWEMQADGRYLRRQPSAGERPVSAQQQFASSTGG